MKRGTFEYIEQTLLDYKDIDKHIKKRIEELKYPVADVDENIGGGKSNKISDPTARMAITIIDDLLISNLQRTKRIVDEVLESMEPEAKRVIDLYYIEKPRKYTWAGVAEATNYSERHCKRIRDRTFKEIAEKLGMPIE